MVLCTAGQWQLTYLTNTNTYTAVSLARSACYNYLAAYPCGNAAVTSFNTVCPFSVRCESLDIGILRTFLPL